MFPAESKNGFNSYVKSFSCDIEIIVYRMNFAYSPRSFSGNDSQIAIYSLVIAKISSMVSLGSCFAMSSRFSWFAFAIKLAMWAMSVLVNNAMSFFLWIILKLKGCWFKNVTHASTLVSINTLLKVGIYKYILYT